MEQIQAVIFDMDGVIVNSEPLHFEAEKTILQTHGIEAPWEKWGMFAGLTDAKIFQYIVENFTHGNYSAEYLLAAKYKIFLKLLSEKLEPIPGAIDFIHWCRSRFLKIALTTSSIKHVQETIFQRFDLNPFFDVIVTEEWIQHCKPHPEPYLKTVQALQLPASHCLVVEDSLNGIKSAKEAGCYVAGITTTFPAEQLRAAGADFVFDQFGTLYHQPPFNNGFES